MPVAMQKLHIGKGGNAPPPTGMPAISCEKARELAVKVEAGNPEQLEALVFASHLTASGITHEANCPAMMENAQQLLATAQTRI